MRSPYGSKVNVVLWYRVTVLCTAIVCMAIGAMAQSDRLSGAEEIISRAQALGARQNYSLAIDLLKPALTRYPTYAPLYLALADLQQAKGANSPTDVQALLDTYGQGILRLGGDREITRRAQALIATQFPLRLGAYGHFVLPGNPATFTFAVRDPRLYSYQRGIQQGLITTVPLDASTAYRYDPKYHTAKYAQDPVYGGWTFKRILYGYLYSRGQQCWVLRYRVIWQEVAGKEDARLQMARETAQLLVRLSGLLDAYTTDADKPGVFTPRFAADGVVNVWLTEKGEPGGEAFNENIYLYNVGIPRSATEWVREVAHELGHQVFKPVGGYQQPEWAASGLLGEALFLRWLMLNVDQENEAHPWLNAFDPAVIFEKRYQPWVREFAESGPADPVLRGVDEAAMTRFVGLALYLESVRGPEYFTGTFDALTAPTLTGPGGFLDALENYVELKAQSLDAPVVTLRLRDLPKDVPHHVFLRDGVWKGVYEGQGFQGNKGKLTIDGKDTPIDAQGMFTLTSTKPGWHQLILKTTDKGALLLSAVKFSRENK